MIQDFTKTIKNDVSVVYNAVTKGVDNTNADRKDVTLAAVRVIATLGMAFAALTAYSALKTFFTASFTGAVVRGLIAALTYAVGRDIFVITQKSNIAMDHFDDVSILKDLKQLVVGKAFSENDVEGTLLAPVWKKVLVKA